MYIEVHDRIIFEISALETHFAHFKLGRRCLRIELYHPHPDCLRLGFQ